MLFYFMSLYIKANTIFSPSGFYGRTISALSLSVLIVSMVVNILLIHHRLKVEFSYLAYLKTKNKKFWEGKPSSRNWGLDGSVSSVNNKKRMKYKLIIVLYIIPSVAFFYLTGTIYGNQAYPIIIRIIGLLILVSYSILFSAWIIKKIKERRKK